MKRYSVQTRENIFKKLWIFVFNMGKNIGKNISKA